MHMKDQIISILQAIQKFILSCQSVELSMVALQNKIPWETSAYSTIGLCTQVYVQNVCYPLELRSTFSRLCHSKVGHCKFAHPMQVIKQWASSCWAVKNWYRELDTTNLGQTSISSCFTDRATKYLIMEF